MIKPISVDVKYNEEEKRTEINLMFPNEKGMGLFIKDEWDGFYMAGAMQRLLNICIHGAKE